MRLLVDIALALIIALAVGLGSAWYAVDQGRLFGTIRIGQWTASRNVGQADADPYSTATIARSGEVPLGAGEGLAFVADRDKDGRPLVGRCTYSVAGQTPPARLWTLTVTDAQGRLPVTQTHRPDLHSREILREPDGKFVINLSASAEPGNWLQIPGNSRFHLVFRLYDAPLAGGSGLAETTMPEITQESCG